MSFFTLANDATFPKIVMFTGAGRQVGTSASAAQFAVAMARAGTKTLLVDADLRRQTVTKMFGGENKPGVADLLRREMLPAGQDSEIEIATAHDNLTLLPAGTGGRGSLSGFQLSHIAALVEQLRGKAQVIVIDSPPCDAFSDASALVKYVDDVCMVVSARKTPFRSIPLAYEILSRAGGKNISLVLTEASAQEEPFAEAARTLAQV
jgi:Mrp family chromosome partitioning ATPase